MGLATTLSAPLYGDDGKVRGEAPLCGLHSLGACVLAAPDPLT